MAFKPEEIRNPFYIDDEYEKYRKKSHATGFYNVFEYLLGNHYLTESESGIVWPQAPLRFGLLDVLVVPFIIDFLLDKASRNDSVLMIPLAVIALPNMLARYIVAAVLATAFQAFKGLLLAVGYITVALPYEACKAADSFFSDNKSTKKSDIDTFLSNSYDALVPSW